MTSLQDIHDKLESIERLLKKIAGEETEAAPLSPIIWPVYIPTTPDWKPYEVWCKNTTSSDSTIYVE